MLVHVTVREGEGDESIAFAPFSGYISSHTPCYPHTLRAAAVGRRTTLERLRPAPSVPGPRGRVETPSAVLHSAGGRTAPPSVSLSLMGRDSAAKRERKSRSDIEIIFASDGGNEVGIHE